MYYCAPFQNNYHTQRPPAIAGMGPFLMVGKQFPGLVKTAFQESPTGLLRLSLLCHLVAKTEDVRTTGGGLSVTSVEGSLYQSLWV